MVLTDAAPIPARVRQSAVIRAENGLAALTFHAVLGVLLVCATGCQHVEFWERGALAEPAMQRGTTPLADLMEEHMFFSREAAAGGGGVGGGGCGCN